jgi:hypothetical protein
MYVLFIGIFFVAGLVNATSSYVWDRSYYLFIFLRIFITIADCVLTIKASSEISEDRRKSSPIEEPNDVHNSGMYI